ncbi:MAG: T9SS type A sorting domain-containing protein, partial [candidate division WOR-3 bacterium]
DTELVKRIKKIPAIAMIKNPESDLGKTKALSDNSLLTISPGNTFEEKLNPVISNELPKTQTTSIELPSYQIVYPIAVENIKDIFSADMQISYNPEKLRPIAIRTTEATRNFLVAGADYEGILRIGMASWQDLNGDVKLLEIVFEGKGEQLVNPEIKVDWIILNDGRLIPTGDGAMGKTEPVRLFSLACKPNPFASKIQIRYSIPKENKVTIRIFNSLGQAVKTLVNNNQKPHTYSITWDGSDDIGNKLANGIYFIRIETDDGKLDKKIVLLRN